MEIEAKFRIDQREIFAELLQSKKLGPFALVPTPGIEYQHNTYFDTPDRCLAARRYSLRVRDLGHRRIATVKRSLGGQSGIHTREEWEIELDRGDDPREWPASAARDRALEALAGRVAAPLVIVQTRRQYMYAVRAASVVAELSLDEGSILAGGRTLAFRELEIELQAAGQRADLDALIGHLLARFPLEPEPLGKKKRGLALLDGLIAGSRLAAPFAPSEFDYTDGVGANW